ncbi:MAG: threonine synthase [Alphaproteobacteria bacterium]|nr:threonine synthase [Alphaproteobacteria bacterium]
MRYISTRHGRAAATARAFDEILLTGLAPDGGLYVPQRLPCRAASWFKALQGLPYAEIATRVTQPFLGGAVPATEWRRMIEAAYRPFTHPAVAPLRQLDAGLWLLELFHGPTLAFKDYALQLVGPLFDRVLRKRRRRITIIGATSGDTGSAAIEACRDREAIDIFMLYPAGRVSEVQRRQMTTVPARNVHAVAVEGTFDDCQDLVKAMFADAAFRDELGLSAVNSINWARIMAQIVYYVAAAVALGAPARKVAFAVPTGNFGNVYAAHIARRLGLPIAGLAIATNRNDILTRFFARGTMSLGAVEPTISPSMDIQVSSNFERLFFELVGESGPKTKAAFRHFRATGTLPTTRQQWQVARALFQAERVDDDETRATMAETYRATGTLIDPHTAVALAAARRVKHDRAAPMVVVATAHPAKFPEAVMATCGVQPEIPPRLANLMALPERRVNLPNDLGAVQRYVRDHARLGAAV